MLKVNFYDRIEDNLDKFTYKNDDGSLKDRNIEYLKLFSFLSTSLYNNIKAYRESQIFEEYMDGSKIRLEYGINKMFTLTIPAIISEGLNYNLDFLSDVKNSAYKKKRFFKSDINSTPDFYFRTKEEIESGGLAFYVDLSIDDQYLEEDITLFIDKFKNYGSTYEFRYT